MERKAIKYSENSAKPEVDFELNWGRIILAYFYQRKLY